MRKSIAAILLVSLLTVSFSQEPSREINFNFTPSTPKRKDPELVRVGATLIGAGVGLIILGSLLGVNSKAQSDAIARLDGTKPKRNNSFLFPVIGGGVSIVAGIIVINF